MTIFINELNLIHSFNIFSRLSVNYNYYYYIIIIIMIMIIIIAIILLILLLFQDPYVKMVSVGCSYFRSIFLQVESSFHFYYYYIYYFPKRKELCTRRQWHENLLFNPSIGFIMP